MHKTKLEQIYNKGS